MQDYGTILIETKTGENVDAIFSTPITPVLHYDRAATPSEPTDGSLVNMFTGTNDRLIETRGGKRTQAFLLLFLLFVLREPAQCVAL